MSIENVRSVSGGFIRYQGILGAFQGVNGVTGGHMSVSSGFREYLDVSGTFQDASGDFRGIPGGLP